MFLSGAAPHPSTYEGLVANPYSLESRLRQRHPSFADDNERFDDLVKLTQTLSLSDSKARQNWHYWWRIGVAPLLLTVLAAWVRLHGIGANQKVIWDEAHFGKFGSHYIQHEFYFDVHPPLGKLLVGLSGYLAGFDGEFKFDSGKPFPEGNQFTKMRIFNCVFGILCTPMAYWTALDAGFSTSSAVYVGLAVALEMLSLTLLKFILLDSMLLFFTVLTYLCLMKIHRLNVQNRLLSAKGLWWLTLTGASIGCVCLVKWVGLFVTLLVGFYVLYDLVVKWYQLSDSTRARQGSVSRYIGHWLSRIACLILVPIFLYVAIFKVHFFVLSRSGPGDGLISTLLQASLEGNTLKNGPRSVAYGSMVTLRSQGLSPNLLHSHPLLYPEGLRQQQITTYGFKDNNNEFLVEFDMATGRDEHRFATLVYDEDSPDNILDYKTLIKDGDTIRLNHKETGCFLHLHAFAAAILKSLYEVSCYGGMDVDDAKDDWVVEVQQQDKSPSAEFQNEDPQEIHPISTNFRLRHKVLGCYLATLGYAYPAWGFQQGEVICKHLFISLDKSTWWNVEDHVNAEFELPSQAYVAPKPKFWKEFILLNYGMMASNNALVPDPDHFDNLASSWWEWPILRRGLRMSSWIIGEPRYLLIGHPFVTYLSTLSIPVTVFLFLVLLYRWRRQVEPFSILLEEWNFLLAAAVFPMLGWLLHYLPFVVMSRVTYLHHYVPALYFAIFVSGFLVEYLVSRKTSGLLRRVLFGLLYAAVLGVFWRYSPLAMGMVTPRSDYFHLKLLSSWQL